MKVTILYRTDEAFHKNPIFPMKVTGALPRSEYFCVAMDFEVNGETVTNIRRPSGFAP